MKIITRKQKEEIWKDLLMVRLFLCSININGKNKKFDKLLIENMDILEKLMNKFL